MPLGNNYIKLTATNNNTKILARASRAHCAWAYSPYVSAYVRKGAEQQSKCASISIAPKIEVRHHFRNGLAGASLGSGYCSD